jgi:fructokinase
MNRERRPYAGVELGGTKCLCVLGTGPDDLRAEVRVATRDPATTLGEIRTVLDGWRAEHGAFAAIGIASFGPVSLRRQAGDFGRIGTTAKPAWSGADVVGALVRPDERRVLGLETDVNGAALAEGRWGAAQGLDDYAYVTVGTGVGVGLVVGGRLAGGVAHGELGHLRVARAADDHWPGACRFHGACVEGLASGPAIAARTGRAASDVPGTDPVWQHVAHAIAQLLQAIVYATVPARIVVGGGVPAARPELLPRIVAELRACVAGYLDLDALTGGLEDCIVPPGLGPLAGPLGALAVAADAVARAEH